MDMIYAKVTKDIFAAGTPATKHRGKQTLTSLTLEARDSLLFLLWVKCRGHLGCNRTYYMNKLMIYDILMTSMLTELLT